MKAKAKKTPLRRQPRRRSRIRLDFRPRSLSGSEPLPAAERFLDKVQVARRLGLTVRTVENWMRYGWVPYYKLRSVVVFKWSEVEARLAHRFRRNTQ